MYLLIHKDKSVTFTDGDQEVVDFLEADPEHQAYGFVGGKVELVDDDESA